MNIDVVGETDETDGLALSDSRFSSYLDLIVEANQRFNLTAIRDRQEMWHRHIEESVALARWMSIHALLADGERLIDIGSGAGVPGIPLAILKPRVAVTLLEATAKKAAFLRHCLEALGLQHVRVVHDRAETAAHLPELRARFDVAVARAVAPLPVLVELALPFLHRGGTLVALKGRQAATEARQALAAIGICGGGSPLIAPFIDDPADERRLIVVSKRSTTPRELPRRPGLPAQQPLALAADETRASTR